MTEYKCNFCGKIFTDRNKYTECVMRCNELETVRQNEEERKKAVANREDRHKQMQIHFNEYLRLCQEEKLCGGSIFGVVLPHEVYEIRGL